MPDDSEQFGYQIQHLAERPVPPREGLSPSDETRLKAAKRTLDQNYTAVSEHVDGTLPENPTLVCREESRERYAFETLRLLHNYLSSLYSFNETVRVLFEQTTADCTLTSGDFTPGRRQSAPHYSRKLEFLRGIRTDFQHGGFSCLQFRRVGTIGELIGYTVAFDCESFLNEGDVERPSRFLRHTNENERSSPVSFIGRFHHETLATFYEDTREWFGVG